MYAKYASGLTLLLLAGCGSNPLGTPAIAITENPGNSSPSIVLPSPTPTATFTPTADQPYTNSYGNIFCNSTTSDMNCFGALTLQTPEAVKGLVIGSDAVCVTYSGVQVTSDPADPQEIGFVDNSSDPYVMGIADVECYSTSAGPIAMNAQVLAGNNHNDFIGYVYINAQGKVCFEIEDYGYSGTSLQASYHPCGLVPTGAGGIE